MGDDRKPEGQWRESAGALTVLC